MGNTWTLELDIFMKSDIREPYFVEWKGQLWFSYFEAGTDPIEFQPIQAFRRPRLPNGQWGPPINFGQPGEVIWQIQHHNGSLYAGSYFGDHYDPDKSDMNLLFNFTTDNVNWNPVNASLPIIYNGGVSEMGF